jgi:hypothetical protein
LTIDTSVVATDPTGLAATSTRTILIDPATPLAPDYSELRREFETNVRKDNYTV